MYYDQLYLGLSDIRTMPILVCQHYCRPTLRQCQHYFMSTFFFEKVPFDEEQDEPEQAQCNGDAGDDEHERRL